MCSETDHKKYDSTCCQYSIITIIAEHIIFDEIKLHLFCDGIRYYQHIIIQIQLLVITHVITLITALSASMMIKRNLTKEDNSEGRF